jgi:hypothetical protein
VKDKTATKLADAFEAMLAEHRLSSTEILEVMLGAPLPSRHKKLARIGFKAGLKHLFKETPEPKKEKVTEMLAMFSVLKGAPHKIRKMLMQGAKEMPHAPGGPPRKIRLEEEITVCAEITSLKAEHDTREAIRRVAAKRHVSVRTIYRIWGKYHPKKRKLRAIPIP